MERGSIKNRREEQEDRSKEMMKAIERDKEGEIQVGRGCILFLDSPHSLAGNKKVCGFARSTFFSLFLTACVCNIYYFPPPRLINFHVFFASI